MINTGIVFFIVLTSLGLIIKLFTLFKVIKPGLRSQAHRSIVFLLFIQLFQSYIEYLGYFIPMVYPNHLLFPLKLYYLCLILTLFLVPYIIALIADIKISKLILYTGLATFLCIASLLAFTGFIVDGAKYNGITFTRIAGPYYAIFQALVISCFIFSITTLLFKATRKKNNFVKSKKLTNILLSYSGLAIFCVSIIFIMPFFEKINAVGFFSILMSLFILGLAHCATRDNVVDFSYWVPFSKRRKLIHQLAKPFITYYEDDVGIDVKKEYDQIVTQHALDLFDGNQTKAAQWLHTSQSFVSRMKHYRKL